jgi:hypothetical protein
VNKAKNKEREASRIWGGRDEKLGGMKERQEASSPQMTDSRRKTKIKKGSRCLRVGDLDSRKKYMRGHEYEIRGHGIS